ncbi:MAG: gamma-glutamyl-gamma-aminobutyrate hydrolase family protein [Pseudohongiellaceae bacterium]
MKRIGVTQRVERLPGRGERRDCLDQRWVTLLAGLCIDAVPVPNGLDDVAAWARRQQLEGLLLTGGNDLCGLPEAGNTAPERDATEGRLLEWAADTVLPVLGVCRGLQFINHYLGGRLSRVEGHVAVHHELVPEPSGPLAGLYTRVNSFHDWAVHPGELAEGLTALAHAPDGTVEAFRHERLGWLAIMWHPEREEPFRLADLDLIRAVFDTDNVDSNDRE